MAIAEFQYFDILKAKRLILVDVEVDPEKKEVRAGWLWVDTGIHAKTLVLKSERNESIKIEIPPYDINQNQIEIRNMPFANAMYHSSKTLNFKYVP